MNAWAKQTVPRSLARYLAIVAVLWTPYAILAVWVAGAEDARSLASFLAATMLLTLLLAYCARTWRMFALAHLPVFWLSIVYAAYTVAYNHPPGESIAFVLLTSSWEETRGFIDLWQGGRLLWMTPALLLVSVLLVALAPGRPMFAGGGRSRWGLLGVIIALCAWSTRSPASFIDGLAVNPVIGTALFVKGPMQRARLAVNGPPGRKVPFGASHQGGEEVHILIVGESARRDSWSVYGYPRMTTPYLARLESEVILFRDAVADANMTAYAVPMMLTGRNPDEYRELDGTGTLVDLAREAGYHTSWLINQDPSITILAGIHADHMGYPHYAAQLANKASLTDEVLLPDFRAELARKGMPRFIGLHVFGSHWQYNLRYPPRFAHFVSGMKPLNFDTAIDGHSDQRVVDAYDNSVLYTDWFLSQVIEQARKLDVPATVTYFSDHGENLYTLDGISGHGTARYEPHQFEVPAFVWMNAAFRAAHPDKVQALERNAGRQVRSHNVFYSVADLMGIQWPAARPERSFASAEYAPDTRSAFLAGGNRVARSN